jgi:hypothetical protein
MSKELTNSQVDRQNILNNSIAMNAIREYIGLSGMLFEGEYKFTKAMLSEFYEIDFRTIERYLESHADELKNNGYELLKGERLKEFKKLFGYILKNQTKDDPDINVSIKSNKLGVFSFRAFLNLGMLLSESEKAKDLRSKILDIVLDSIYKTAGGSTKYINQRDEDFIQAIAKEPQYRKEFTSALSQCLEMGNYKYSVYTDKVYKAIFKENAKEYKQILQLEEKDNARDTMYSEVLTLIASFETGIAHEMRNKSESLGRKLSPSELDEIFETFSNHPAQKPLIESARTKMASRDYGLRKIVYPALEENIKALSKGEFDRFLGEKSKELKERIEENIEVFKRLRDR